MIKSKIKSADSFNEKEFKNNSLAQSSISIKKTNGNKSFSISKLKVVDSDDSFALIKRSLSKEQLDMLYQKHCEKVQEKYEKILIKNPKKNVERERYIDFKRCETCFDFINDKLLLLCEICDDGYHTYCLNPPQENVPKYDFICKNCWNQMPEGTNNSNCLNLKIRQSKFEDFKFVSNISNCNKKVKFFIQILIIYFLEM